MSQVSNIAYNKKLNQICPIAYSKPYANTKQIIHKVAKGSFQNWIDADVTFLTVHQVEKLIDSEDSWDEPSKETLKLIGL